MRKFLSLSLGFTLALGCVANPTPQPEVQPITFPSNYNLSGTEVDLDPFSNDVTEVTLVGDLSTQGSSDVVITKTSDETTTDGTRTETLPVSGKGAEDQETTNRALDRGNEKKGRGKGRRKELREKTENYRGDDQDRVINKENGKKNDRNFSKEDEITDATKIEEEEENNDDSNESEERIKKEKRKPTEDGYREAQDFYRIPKFPGPPNLQAWLQASAPVLPGFTRYIDEMKELKEILPRIRRSNNKGEYECPNNEIEAKKIKKKPMG